MKRISHTSRSRDKLLHIETDLGIVNIRVGLTDSDGHPTESIEILPDNYAGEIPVVFHGFVNNRLIKGGEKQVDATELLAALKSIVRHWRDDPKYYTSDLTTDVIALIDKAESNG